MLRLCSREAWFRPVEQKAEYPVILKVRQCVDRRLLNLHIRVVQQFDQGDGGRGIASPSQCKGSSGPHERVGILQGGHQLVDKGLRFP